MHMSIAMNAPETGFTPVTCEKRLPAVPCHLEDPDLWFAESPVDLERAKSLCADCPIRNECLAAALERQEPWGVWGGEILDRGSIVARKRPRGRPRKDVESNPAAA
ncbi:WhiB family transcriptional regulator [Mycobacterium sp. 141]|uniref:WhiB family transcriptional regulator n=1 Tax=Mycobacterium sp. 141 TaxID=1120797 RepID=UPI00037164D8|nr:WhiB family transcriptional regulator [Mycobacterium sp. 141]